MLLLLTALNSDCGQEARSSRQKPTQVLELRDLVACDPIPPPPVRTINQRFREGRARQWCCRARGVARAGKRGDRQGGAIHRADCSSAGLSSPMGSYGAKIMTRRTFSRNCLELAFLSALIGALPHAALALPKGSGGGQCACICEAPSGTAPGGKLYASVNYASRGYSCDAFNGATCNIDNPITGGVATGSLLGCGNAAVSRPVIIFSPSGGIQVVPSRLKRH